MGFVDKSRLISQRISFQVYDIYFLDLEKVVQLAYIITKRMLSEKKRVVVHEPNTKNRHVRMKRKSFGENIGSKAEICTWLNGRPYDQQMLRLNER